MSRHGYTEDLCDDHWALIRYRGRVKSAMRGKRGRALLRDLIASLDAMPDKRLIAGTLKSPEGEYCAIGVVAESRGVELSPIDPMDCEDKYGEDPELAEGLDVAPCLLNEVEFINDEFWPYDETDKGSARWKHVRRWAQRQLDNAEAFAEKRRAKIGGAA